MTAAPPPSPWLHSEAAGSDALAVLLFGPGLRCTTVKGTLGAAGEHVACTVRRHQHRRMRAVRSALPGFAADPCRRQSLRRGVARCCWNEAPLRAHVPLTLQRGSVARGARSLLLEQGSVTRRPALVDVATRLRCARRARKSSLAPWLHAVRRASRAARDVPRSDSPVRSCSRRAGTTRRSLRLPTWTLAPRRARAEVRQRGELRDASVQRWLSLADCPRTLAELERQSGCAETATCLTNYGNFALP
jgi:hypothetical protein